MSKKKLAGIVVACIIVVIIIVVIASPAPATKAPPEFVVSNLDVSPEEVEPGETVTITVEVQNVGEQEGTHELELILDGLVEQSESVTLDGGQTTSVSFSVQKDMGGSYDVEIAELTGSFVIIEPVPDIITLQGTGVTATGTFTLEKGLSIFHMTHDGNSNFSVWLYDAQTGETVDLLANVTGSYDGSTIVGVTGETMQASAGEHLLDVDADGNWEVIIEQPRPVTAPTAPQTFTGKGPDVPQAFYLEQGTATFHMVHDGTSNFAIWLYDRDGYSIDLLVNEIGPFDGSTVVGVTGGIFGAAPGIHYVAIEADGNWEVRVEQ